MGVIGEEHWFIPKFTAGRDNSLLSYMGLAGEQNREKLADRFHRPTTWIEYCEEVSPTGCQNDTVASRYPDLEDDKKDRNRYFVEGVYKGHFRKTEANDCESNPTTCTGHIFNYFCGWTSYVKPQLYHLGIPLESNGPEANGRGGYNYGELVDAIKAANATKSDIVIFWWTPESVS